MVGPHLALLGQYFIGYRVSFVGSLIGSPGRSRSASSPVIAVVWIYNLLAGLRAAAATGRG